MGRSTKVKQLIWFKWNQNNCIVLRLRISSSCVLLCAVCTMHLGSLVGWKNNMTTEMNSILCNVHTLQHIQSHVPKLISKNPNLSIGKEDKVFSNYSDERNIFSEPTCNLANQTYMHFGHHFLSFIDNKVKMGRRVCVRAPQIFLAGDTMYTAFRQQIENLKMKPIKSWIHHFSLIKWIYYNFDIEYQEMQYRTCRLHPVYKEASIDEKLIYSRHYILYIDCIFRIFHMEIKMCAHERFHFQFQFSE